MTRALAALLALGACGKSADSPAPSATAAAAAAPDCAGVGSAMTKFWADRAAAKPTQEEKDAALQIAPVATARIVGHCEHDKWSAEATTCMKKGDFAACESKLTKDQVDKLRSSAPPL